MLLYNITVGIDKEVELEWKAWVLEFYIAAAMRTGLFTDFKFYKVLTHDDEMSVSYSIQLYSETIDNVVIYLEKFAPLIVEEQRTRFLNKHVVFNTLLEEVQ
jgi:hypothetical protein